MKHDESKKNTTTISSKLRWSPDEDDILIKNFDTMGLDVVNLLHGRTKSACRHRALVLKLIEVEPSPPAQKWTDREDKILRRFYPSMGSRVHVLLPGRTVRSCQSRAKKLKLKFY